ncbi:hypothetical protein BCAR13_940030 [Paraburkholderia caribensis]|nr:hypothetical protein BCAR13_940030 [Paraburkholderia caribensis]
MYRHDLRYFFRFYSVIIAELCGFAPHFTPFVPLLLGFFSAVVSDHAARGSISMRVPGLRIVSCQFLPDLFSIFPALRNYSLMHDCHFALELFGRNSMPIY